MHPDYDYCLCEDTLSHREAVRLSDEYDAVLQKADEKEIVTTQAERCVVARCSNPTVNPQRCYYSPNVSVDAGVRDSFGYLVLCTFHAELFPDWKPFVEPRPYSTYLYVTNIADVLRECLLCGAAVSGQKIHTEWHNSLEEF